MTIEELKQRAAAGDAEAMCDLGMAYFHGEGVEQDQEKAVELLQASVDAGDEYAPFLLGQMYLYGHIDDEDAGYNGMRFLAIAANRGAEGFEKEIAEHRLNFAKCHFKDIFDGVDSLSCPQDLLNYLGGKVDSFIIECQDRKINKPEHFSWSSRDGRSSSEFYLDCFVENPPTVKNKHFYNYILANVLEASLEYEQFDFAEKAAILCKAAELVWGIDAPWVEEVLYLLYRRFADINLSAGNVEKAADIYVKLSTNAYICYISQFDVDDIDAQQVSQKEVDRMLVGEERYYDSMLKLLYSYWRIKDNEDNVQSVLDKLCEVLETQRMHNSPTPDEWLLEQLKNAEEDKEEGNVNVVNLLGHNFFGYFMAPYVRFFDGEAFGWNGESIEEQWSRERFELIELVIKKMPAYFEQEAGGCAFGMMVLNRFKAQYHMLTRRYRLVEQELLYAMGFFKKAIATVERETVVLHYARCIKSLYQFYKVQRMEDKKAKLILYMDVLVPEDYQEGEVAELKNLLNS